jgi:hypothetical protein
MRVMRKSNIQRNQIVEHLKNVKNKTDTDGYRPDDLDRIEDQPEEIPKESGETTVSTTKANIFGNMGLPDIMSQMTNYFSGIDTNGMAKTDAYESTGNIIIYHEKPNTDIKPHKLTIGKEDKIIEIPIEENHFIPPDDLINKSIT